jgi:hypothetical protein
MPKYTIDEVIEIVKNLEPEEKIALKARLEPILGGGGIPNTSLQAQTQQSQSFGNITLGDRSEVDIGQFSAEGAIDLDKSQTQIQATGEGGDLQEALALLKMLKTEVDRASELNKLQKTIGQGAISVVEQELSRPEPDKDLIEEAIAALEKGLKGVERLIEPTVRVAKIVGTALIL